MYGRVRRLMAVSDSRDQVFIHVDSVEHDGVVITATSSKANHVFIIAETQDIQTPVVCKISNAIEDLAFSKISPDLEYIACFSTNNSFNVYTLSTFLSFIRPNRIPGLTDNPMFDYESLKFNATIPNTPFSVETSNKNKFIPIDAYWWKFNRQNYLIIIETNGVHIFNIKSLNTILRSIQISDISTSAFKTSKNKAKIAIFTKVNTNLLTFSLEDGEITSSVTSDPTVFSQNGYVLAQFSHSKSDKWYLSILGKKVNFVDKNLTMIPITSFEASHTNTKAFAVTDHMLFSSNNDGNANVRFIKSIDTYPVELIHDVQLFSIINSKADSVVLMSPNEVARYYLPIEPEKKFYQLLKERKFREAFIISNGFSLETKSLCQLAATKSIKSGDFAAALEILNEGSCDIKSCLQRFIGEGMERYALHYLLRAHEGLEPDVASKIAEALTRKIEKKLKPFLLIATLFKRQHRKEDLQQPPNRFIRSKEAQKIKNNEKEFIDALHPGLIFSYQFALGIEDTSYIRYASPLDIPQTIPATFSHAYSTLLKAVAASRPAISEKLDYPPTAQIIGDFYITANNDLYQKGRSYPVANDILVAARFMNSIYAIDTNFRVFRGDDSIEIKDLEEVIDMPLSIYVCSDERRIAFLTVSGTVMSMDVAGQSKSFEGAFVDICFAGDKLFGLGDDGIVRDLDSDRTFVDRFTIAITRCGSKPLLVHEDGFSVGDVSEAIDFRIICTGGGDKSILLGINKAVIVNENGSYVIRDLDRTGTLLYAFCQNNRSIVCGSASAPFVVLDGSQNHWNPCVEDANTIASSFPPDLTLQILSTPGRGLLKCFYGDFDSLDEEEAREIVPDIEALGSAAGGAIHRIAQLGVDIPMQVLKTDAARASFAQHPEDIALLPKDTLAALLPSGFERVDASALAMKFLQPPPSSVVVQSFKLSDGVRVFSCGHSLSSKEAVQEVGDAAESLRKRFPMTAEALVNEYKRDQIHAQCPKCLSRAMSSAFK